MKTAILITARLKSTRLPLKAIKPIHGRSMFCHLLDRLKLARRPQEIIVCTSPARQDDPLVEIARAENVQAFRGDPQDVLQRLTDAARRFGVDVVVNCMADNPFTDPEYIDRLVDYHLENRHDYSRTEGLPLGCFAYLLSYPAMLKACQCKADRDTEIWGDYFTKTGLFRWGTMKVADPGVLWPELRLTVDTPEDFDLVTRIFDELYEPGKVMPLREVLALCRRRPELPALNAHVRQREGPPIHLKAPGSPAGD
jgi:spore coat polysaccharide biosynthesis protein SpsF